MLLSKSSCVCIPCFKSVAPKVCLAKAPFLAFFGPDMNTEMGVVIYMHVLKYFPEYIPGFIQRGREAGPGIPPPPPKSKSSHIN